MLGIIAVLLGLLGVGVAIYIPVSIEKKKRPALRIERADDLNARDREPPWRIVHIKVVNEPLGGRLARWLLTNVATSCKVSVTFTSRSDGKDTTIPGRWSATPQPLILLTGGGYLGKFFDDAKVPETLRFDLSPDPEGEVLGIAVKIEGDPAAYAFTSESYAANDKLRLPRLALPDEEYDVTVTARAGGIEESEQFTLFNRGRGMSGLELVPYESAR